MLTYSMEFPLAREARQDQSREYSRSRRSRNQGLFFLIGAIIVLVGRLVYGIPSVSIPIHMLLMIALLIYIWNCHRRMKRALAQPQTQ
jgi:Flp pilus assembly protein TadB